MSATHPHNHERHIWAVERQRQCCGAWEPIAFRKGRHKAEMVARFLRGRRNHYDTRVVIYAPSPEPGAEK